MHTNSHTCIPVCSYQLFLPKKTPCHDLEDSFADKVDQHSVLNGLNHDEDSAIK